MKKFSALIIAILITILTPNFSLAEEAVTETETVKTEVVETVIESGDETTIEVLDANIATGIKDFAPVGSAEEFSSDIHKLYCHTKIENGANMTILHKWYHDDKLMVAIPLAVKSNLYRTWSSKTIRPEWTGDWKVEVTTEDGTVLNTLDFVVN
ncbi:MAG: DUF2914 domain-containing protein [Deltaproteobacteria bacterium]|nr:DUF2914 domain-containing protein [Deltaproteobacteria bacterium]